MKVISFKKAGISIKNTITQGLINSVENTCGVLHFGFIGMAKVVEKVESKLLSPYTSQVPEDIIICRRNRTDKYQLDTIQIINKLVGRTRDLSKVSFGTKEEVIIEQSLHGDVAS